MSISKDEWKKGQSGEASHWLAEDPEEMIVTGEIHGQVVAYAKFMEINNDYLIVKDLAFAKDYNKDYYKNKYYDLQGKSICDIGGGPTSLLLRCKNFSKAVVVDPILCNDRVKQRYAECGINFLNIPAEEHIYEQYDEIWIYNCLHHVIDPKKILEDCLISCKKLRLYEILHTKIDLMHPHSFTEDYFNSILPKGGKTKDMLEPPPSPRGIGYYGVFNL